MFENLTDKLERSFKILKGEGRITEINIAETLKEIRRALIDADVNYKAAKSFTDQRSEAEGAGTGRIEGGEARTDDDQDRTRRAGPVDGRHGDGTSGWRAIPPWSDLVFRVRVLGPHHQASWLLFIKSKKGRQVLLVAGDVTVRQPSTS